MLIKVVTEKLPATLIFRYILLKILLIELVSTFELSNTVHRKLSKRGPLNIEKNLHVEYCCKNLQIITQLNIRM